MPTRGGRSPWHSTTQTYQKCKLVKGKAKRLGIELLYLPFYSQKQINGEIGIAIPVKVF
jgi:transposase